MMSLRKPICHVCGRKEHRRNAQFCPICGRSFSSSSPPPLTVVSLKERIIRFVVSLGPPTEGGWWLIIICFLIALGCTAIIAGIKMPK